MSAPLTYVIDHNCARKIAVLNACHAESEWTVRGEGRVRFDQAAQVYTTQDPEVVQRMTRLGARCYPT